MNIERDVKFAKDDGVYFQTRNDESSAGRLPSVCRWLQVHMSCRHETDFIPTEAFVRYPGELGLGSHGQSE